MALYAAVGCGGKDYSAAGPAAGTQRCESPSSETDEAGLKPVKQKQTFTVDLSKSISTAGKVELQVQSVEEVGSVRDAFTDKGVFRPKARQRFIAVTYALVNRGTTQIEAANSVNQLFGLGDPRTRTWSRADRDEDCSTVSPSYASAQPGLDSPELDVKPGKGYRTAAVYSVPVSAKELSWWGAGHAIRVDTDG